MSDNTINTAPSTKSKIKVKSMKKNADAGADAGAAAVAKPVTNDIITPAVPVVPVVPTTPQDTEQTLCAICIEPFTTKVRRCLKCPYCNNCICSQCLEKYLLNTIEEPHCVSCRKGWSQSLLQTFCTKTFLTKTYAEYRSNILLNRSKSFLPLCQQQAERIRAASKYRDQTKQMMNEVKELTEEFDKYQQEFERKRRELWRQIDHLVAIAGEIESGQRDLEGNTIVPAGGAGSEASVGTPGDTQERKKFIRRCPSDGCNGFLSSAWKCGLCSNWTCPDCFVVKGQDRDLAHTCSTEDKATADEIRKRTKPCPNCGELIEKAEGCDQMFCTSCHSPFSWTKGEIIKTGIIHNPHYFEWLRRNGGEPARDIPNLHCGGLPRYTLISTRLHEMTRGLELENPPFKNELLAKIQYLENAYRTSGHIIGVERNRWNAHTHPVNDSELAVAFLLNRISQDEWRNYLKIQERARHKSKEVSDILDAFINAVIDIWRQIYGEIREQNVTRQNLIMKLREWHGILEQLRLFVNPPLLEISNIYNCIVPQITENFEMISTSVAKIRRKTKLDAMAAAAAKKKDETVPKS